MESNKLVSLIVPVYNVEKYIKECIESILQQTYSNIEIIVVDDGSPDNSADIVKKISENDPRVKLISKGNGGVSSARNVGLNLANGDYVIFVDADDFLAKDAVQYMMWLVTETHADFCLSVNCYTQKNEQQSSNNTFYELTAEKAVALLISPKVIVGCWNKIYSTEFLRKNKIRFSEELFYGEGLYFITSCAMKSSVIGVGTRKTYYYRRSNEGSATAKFDIQKMVNGEKAIRRIKREITIDSKIINDMFNLHMALFCLGAITKIINAKKKKVYLKEYRRWKSILKENTLKILPVKEISLYRKVMLCGGILCPHILAFLDKKRRKKIISNSF